MGMTQLDTELQPASTEYPQTMAAVDLGSNSFHMIVARVDSGQLQVIDRIKENVRLGEGLDKNKRLDPKVETRALECLEVFGQRLRPLPQGAVRAVGTNTLRQVRDSKNFLRAAEKALGHAVEIISGREEARLIYLGVAHGLAGADSRLVVDIGGGSTELIIGQNFEPMSMESLHMGCVSMSQRFFKDGKITEDSMKEAVIAGRLEIRPVRAQFNADQWSIAIGSSGTIKAIRNIVQRAGWSEEGITRSSLKKLRRALVAAGHVDKLELDGLSEQRRPVLAGGVAVLSAVFKSLDLETMRVSDESLREGLIYEMLGYIRHEDVRERTVESLMQRYAIDTQQAKRVEIGAIALLSQVAREWELTAPEFSELLSWAASLHEIGLAVSHSSFHKHGAYLLTHSDLSGFSRQQQRVLAALVRGHRRHFPESDFEALPERLITPAIRLCILLRLSVLLHRGRSPHGKPMLYLDVDNTTIRATFPDKISLKKHPLTLIELEEEAKKLEQIGYTLVFS
jgi:exopolyphosphatase / guanosine-5'-triphosphate,3'-diphosphate pyrophosphatase